MIRASLTYYLPSTLALLGLALLLGATVYETIVMAPNYERDIPAPGSRHARGHAEIIDGAFTLQADGHYRARLVFRVTSDTVVYLDSAVHTGRYVHRRDSLIFRATSRDQVNAAGQLVGSALTFRYPGWTFVYRR